MMKPTQTRQEKLFLFKEDVLKKSQGISNKQRKL